MKKGVYVLSVNNYNRRSTGRGFIVEIEFDGQVFRIEHDKVLKTGDTSIVAKIQYSRKTGFSIIDSLASSQTSRQAWGLKTQNFHPVNLLMLSPNQWDDRPVGNKHYFLKEDLTKHRKVLEMVGSRMAVEGPAEQLSGLGFSSTMRNSVVCQVKGSFTRSLKIVF